VQASANPFVRAITTMEVKVTAPGGAVVLDTLLKGPFTGTNAAQILSA
jgi:hypothetical protein